MQIHNSRANKRKTHADGWSQEKAGDSHLTQWLTTRGNTIFWKDHNARGNIMDQQHAWHINAAYTSVELWSSTICSSVTGDWDRWHHIIQMLPCPQLNSMHHHSVVKASDCTGNKEFSSLFHALDLLKTKLTAFLQSLDWLFGKQGTRVREYCISLREGTDAQQDGREQSNPGRHRAAHRPWQEKKLGN